MRVIATPPNLTIHCMLSTRPSGDMDRYTMPTTAYVPPLNWIKTPWAGLSSRGRCRVDDVLFTFDSYHSYSWLPGKVQLQLSISTFSNATENRPG